MKTNLVIALVTVATIIVLLTCGILVYRGTGFPAAFEYRVCFVQGTRVTFVNGAWQGQKPMNVDDAKTSVASCPEKYEYLATAGADGWELVAVLELVHVKDDAVSEL